MDDHDMDPEGTADTDPAPENMSPEDAEDFAQFQHMVEEDRRVERLAEHAAASPPPNPDPTYREEPTEPGPAPLPRRRPMGLAGVAMMVGILSAGMFLPPDRDDR